MFINYNSIAFLKKSKLEFIIQYLVVICNCFSKKF